MLEKISLISENAQLVLSTDGEVNDAEEKLGIRFPAGYREYVTRLGEGFLGGTYVRIYPPRRILSGVNNNTEWRKRISDYWFWDEGSKVLSQEHAIECVIIGDTYDGDELVIHESSPDRIYVLPRHSGSIHIAGDNFFDAIEWLCSSGVLTEAFEERIFDPFDSRSQN